MSSVSGLPGLGCVGDDGGGGEEGKHKKVSFSGMLFVCGCTYLTHHGLHGVIY